MSVSPKTNPAAATTAMPTIGVRIELFEPAMCCSTGVCGPSVDQQLVTVREDLRWAQEQGAEVVRHNLTSNTDAFVANAKVTGLMQAFGERALPALLIDGEIHSHGSYPTREELAAAIAREPAGTAGELPQAGGCGCGPGGC